MTLNASATRGVATPSFRHHQFLLTFDQAIGLYTKWR